MQDSQQMRTNDKREEMTDYVSWDKQTFHISRDGNQNTDYLGWDDKNERQGCFGALYTEILAFHGDKHNDVGANNRVHHTY